MSEFSRKESWIVFWFLCRLQIVVGLLVYGVAMVNFQTILIDDFFHMYVHNADTVSCLLDDGIVQ